MKKGHRYDGDACSPAMLAVEYLPTYRCNYRCSYCSSRAREESDMATMTAVQAHLRQLPPLILAISGGEPSVWPLLRGMLEFCIDLGPTRVVIDTNLSSDLRASTGQVFEQTPSLWFIHATYHEEKAEFSPFIRRVRALHEAGIAVDVRVIAVANRYDQTRAIYDRFCDEGIIPRLKLQKLRKRQGRTHRSGMLADYYGEYLDWVRALGQDPSTQGLPETLGMLCSAGEKYQIIDPHGWVYRCASALRAGDLMRARTAEDSSVPAPCPYRYCHCRIIDKFTLAVAAEE
jgi:MoaA/NifB/PqqE/SkfB family radical SAM enzyme